MTPFGPNKPDEFLEFLLKPDEPYPFAKAVALLTFRAWMCWPDDDEMISAAQIAAAASVAVYQKRNGLTVTPPLSIDILSEALVENSLPGVYADAFEDAHESISDIVGFFMHCPDELKPSLLKARYFIDQGGFAPSEIDKSELKQYKQSPTTMKAAWNAQAPAGPFVWAVHFNEEVVDILSLSPDSVEDVEMAQTIATDIPRMKRLFGIARFCQERLLNLLDAGSASRFKFVKFPDSIRPIAPDLELFDEAQRKIMESYHAPQ